MFRIISLLAVTFFVAACDMMTNLNGTSKNSSPNSRSSTVEAPSDRCPKENIPASLKATFGKYRLGHKGDFIPPIRNYTDSEDPNKLVHCTLFAADFNEDGKKDYAVLLVDAKTFKTQFRLAFATADGKFNSVAIRDYEKPPKSIKGTLYTAMFLKRSGELGPAQRKNFPIVPGTPERANFVAKPAIQLWRPFLPNTPAIVKADPSNYDLYHLAYCSEVFHWENEELQTTVICN